MKQIKRIVLCLCIVFSIILVSESFEPTTVLAKTEKQATKKEVRAAKKAYKKFLVSNKVKDTHFKLVYLGDNPIPYLVTGTPFLSETRNGKRIRKNKDSCMEVNIYTYKNKKVKYCTLFAHSGSSPRVLYNKRSLILTRFCLSRIYFSKGKLYQEDLTYDDYAPIDISQKQFDSNFNVFQERCL